MRWRIGNALRRLFGGGNGGAPTGQRSGFLLRRNAVAKYDAAQTTVENRRHWVNADGLSAAAANSAYVRRTLRNRARYETANNSYARGIVDTLANDTIGRGPRFQFLSADLDANQRVENSFAAWAREIRLAEKLRTLRKAKATDGEALAVFTTNRALRHAVKLDVRPFECDHLDTPPFMSQIRDGSIVEGIEFDAERNPAFYHVCRVFPNELGALDRGNWDRLPVEKVLHWFTTHRPGQIRGIPDLTPALPLFAQLRRFTLAVLAAAETAADFAGIVYTDAPANGESAEMDPFLPIEIEQRILSTLPAGWKMEQLKAEQPATTYPQFKAELLAEIARCLQMPFNVASGNSSGYNYASGRLDVQVYARAIGVEQDELAIVLLDRIVSAWLDEAALSVPGLLPDARMLPAGLLYPYFWDGREQVDPAKEANAQATRLANHTTTLASEYAARGIDWREALRQRAAEVQYAAELGLPLAPPGSSGSQSTIDPANDGETIVEQQ